MSNVNTQVEITFTASAERAAYIKGLVASGVPLSINIHAATQATHEPTNAQLAALAPVVNDALSQFNCLAAPSGPSDPISRQMAEAGDEDDRLEDAFDATSESLQQIKDDLDDLEEEVMAALAHIPTIAGMAKEHLDNARSYFNLALTEIQRTDRISH